MTTQYQRPASKAQKRFIADLLYGLKRAGKDVAAELGGDAVKTISLLETRGADCKVSSADASKLIDKLKSVR